MPPPMAIQRKHIDGAAT